MDFAWINGPFLINIVQLAKPAHRSVGINAFLIFSLEANAICQPPRTRSGLPADESRQNSYSANRVSECSLLHPGW